MFYAIYMATRPRARACIFHKTLGLMLYLLRTCTPCSIQIYVKKQLFIIILFVHTESAAWWGEVLPWLPGFSGWRGKKEWEGIGCPAQRGDPETVGQEGESVEDGKRGQKETLAKCAWNKENTDTREMWGYLFCKTNVRLIATFGPFHMCV